jgi:hypothetical protein
MVHTSEILSASSVFEYIAKGSKNKIDQLSVLADREIKEERSEMIVKKRNRLDHRKRRNVCFVRITREVEWVG